MLDYLLTEEQIMVRDLARQITDEKIRPVAGEYDRNEKFPWDMSQVSIRSSLVDAEAAYSGPLGDEITHLKEMLPDKGKWTVLVPLQQDENGCWRGEALNKRKETMVVEYDRQTGVTVTRKEV